MPDISILFWNMNRKGSAEPLLDLMREHGPDILILAETGVGESALVKDLNTVATRHYNITVNRSERLSFFVAAPPECFRSTFDAPGIAVRQFTPFLGPDLLIIAVHLGSKMYLSDMDQAMLATRLRNVVSEAEDQVGHRRTVLIGDLNMNPFEHGVVSSEGLHAVMTRSHAAKRERTVQGEPRRYFYNPMWSMMGDCSSGPPGSYFYNDSAPITYFWNTFDQILLRPELADRFRPGDVQILDTAGLRALLGPTGHPDSDISDHLPLIATVRVEEASTE